MGCEFERNSVDVLALDDKGGREGGRGGDRGGGAVTKLGTTESF